MNTVHRELPRSMVKLDYRLQQLSNFEVTPERRSSCLLFRGLGQNYKDPSARGMCAGKCRDFVHGSAVVEVALVVEEIQRMRAGGAPKVEEVSHHRGVL